MKADKIILWHIQILPEIDDLMETLRDLDLLNEEGKKVATQIWIKTRKENKWETREEKLSRIMEENWNKFDEWTQDYLISQKDTVNKYAKAFLESKIIPDLPHNIPLSK